MASTTKTSMGFGWIAAGFKFVTIAGCYQQSLFVLVLVCRPGFFLTYQFSLLVPGLPI